ncbi:MFS transporter [Proteus myxofaciens]|uniref:Putative transporter n=1 Tax=Proteus myxofaciens ATCC 19692 TaxID=1354337 RepID=A0A198FQF7_9GAMM|nr:MFS transporter [Proteus myxofaciens]OAT27108.1 putative transporter [Proteus myxofaciens ATCC 19692]
MRIVFFYMLFIVLTADGLMVFLAPVMVYSLTKSIEYAGLTYALWWLPRVFLIPLIGKYIDNLGIRIVSIISDSCKIIGCLFLILVTFSSDLMIAICFGIMGSLISIGNSQTLLSYEKIIALISDDKENHVNLLSRMDFLGMIVGPAIGIIFIDSGYKYLLFFSLVFYLINIIFFIFYYHDVSRNNNKVNNDVNIYKKTSANIIYLLSTPILLLSTFMAIGNNMFDGLIEASGTALIDRVINLPIKYFGFIDIIAGVCGVLGTYLYSYIIQCVGRIKLLIFSLVIIIVSSSFLIIFSSSFFIFIFCYAISIIGKVFTGNIFRILRIKIIPIDKLASISSLIILFNQLILPIVGTILFLSTGEIMIIYLLMIISIGITLMAGIVLIIQLSLENKKQLTHQ